MIQPVAFTVFWLASAVALMAAWKTVRNTRVNDAMFYAVSAVEIGAVVLLLTGVIALVRTDRDVAGTLLISYLVTLVLVPPVALVWGVAEKSRWGTGVLLIGMWTVAILAIRTLQVWHG
jgi:F0F1-type ATP synthase assembly protein I